VSRQFRAPIAFSAEELRLATGYGASSGCLEFHAYSRIL